MHGAYKHSIAAVLALGLAPGAAFAAPGGGALSGPVDAIAKAHAAADKAEQRATKHDGEAATAFEGDVAPAARSQGKGKGSATAGSVGDAAATQQPGTDAAQADEGGEQKAVVQAPYDPTQHRDPFRPPRLNGTAQARTPLETYQLGQLKLVGVVAQPAEGYRAMVEDAAGLGYIITTGTPIGSSGGVVRSIEPRRVVIEESTRDFYGDVKSKEIVMELPQEDRSP